MDELINELNHYLIENQARYMVGDRLSLADISVCSMLAPLLEIKGTPWEREEDGKYRPIGVIIRNIYLICRLTVRFKNISN